MGEVWLEEQDQHLRLVAGQAYARSPLGKAKLRDLLRSLDDQEPINRVFALKAVERIGARKIGRDDYQLTAIPADRKQQIDRLLREFTSPVDKTRDR
jgi:hypothetical protein